MHLIETEPPGLEPQTRQAPVVALLVDYPLLLRAIRAKDPDAVPDLRALVRRAMSMGGLLVARAYGAWYDPEEARVAFTAGLDPVYVPPVGAAGAPTAPAIVADGLAMLRAAYVQAFALSGDDRLLPLISAAHAEGLPVGLIAHSCAPNGPCLPLAGVAEPAAAFARALTRAERYRRPA